MKNKIVVAMIVLAVLLAGCASAQSTPSAYPAPGLRAPGLGGGVTNSQPEAAPATVAPVTDSKAALAGGAGNASALERMIVMNVNLSIVVADPQKKMDEINQLAKSLGGHLVSMNMAQVYTQSGTMAPQGTITVRIPADKLDDALKQIKTGVVDVTSEDRSGEDVTSQYVDLQSQLNNLQKAEQDLPDIMDEAKNNPGNDSTTKTQDVLNVYNQIVSIRGQIEQIQGQMKVIEETTSTSSITVTLVAEDTIKPIQIGGWKPQGVARDALQSLVKFLQGFVNFLIYMIILVLPILIVIFGPIALIIWGIIALVRRGRNKKSKAA
jgi:hypothetical protein